MTALFPHLAFDETETAMSFAVRLAALHTGGGVTPFLTDMSIRTDRLARGDEASVRRLASVAGADPAALIANTPIGVGSRRYVLRGFELSSEFLSSPAIVFCPACLRADDARDPRPDVGRRGRLSWTLRPVRTCPEHGIALVHRMPGPREPKLPDLSVRAPERGADLHRLIQASERRSPSPLQTYVEARLEGASGPAWLEPRAMEQAVRACEMLGALLKFGPAATLKAFSPCDWDRAGRAGFAAAERGEAGIREALSQVQAEFRAKGAQPGARKVFGRLYEWLSSHRPEKAPGDIKRILREHVFATMEMEAGREVLGAALDRRRLHSVATLAAETALDRRTLRNVLAARGLVGHDPAALYDVFDAEAGRAVAASVQRVVHAIGLPKALNCSRPQGRRPDR